GARRLSNSPISPRPHQTTTASEPTTTAYEKTRPNAGAAKEAQKLTIALAPLPSSPIQSSIGTLRTPRRAASKVVATSGAPVRKTCKAVIHSNVQPSTDPPALPKVWRTDGPDQPPAVPENETVLMGRAARHRSAHGKPGQQRPRTPPQR